MSWSDTDGSVMALTVSQARNERLANRMSSSVIVAFREDEIALKSHGNTSSFRRTAGP
jgi:hypothetical protein